MEEYAERAASTLTVLKHKCPSLPQTALDTAKILHNKVGHFTSRLPGCLHLVPSSAGDSIRCNQQATSA